MSNAINLVTIAAFLSASGALLNAFTAVSNRYDAKLKATKDTLATRASFINQYVNDGVINASDSFIMLPICEQILRAESDIKEAGEPCFIKNMNRIYHSNIEIELRKYFFSLIHRTLQSVMKHGSGTADPEELEDKISEINNIYRNI